MTVVASFGGLRPFWQLAVVFGKCLIVTVCLHFGKQTLSVFELGYI